VLSAIVLISIVGAINGNILTGARIPFAQARDGLFFSRFGRIHPRFETPGLAIVAQALWSGVLIVTGSFQTLASYSIFSAWIFYTLSVLAVWVLRRKLPGAARPYRMWGYPATLWLFLLPSLWYMVDSLWSQPVPSLMALLIAAAGIPFYLVWQRSMAAPSSRQRTPAPR
jgi:APA family basic amino acid/polyamine antiporter